MGQLFKYTLWETIICQTIIRPISFCYNMSDRFLCAVIICQTGCYNKSDTFYANNLLIYCAVIYQTTGNYQILPGVICQTNSVIICQTDNYPILPVIIYQTNSVIICQTDNYPILPVVICQTNSVIICQTENYPIWCVII